MKIPRIKDAKRAKWTLDKDGLTQGSIGVFLNCPEQFRILYCEGWEQRELSFAIEFGEWWHYACEINSVATACNKWLKTKNTPKETTQTRRNATEGSALLSVLHSEWESYFNEPNKSLEWVKKEEAFRQDYRLGSEDPIPLRGKIDGLIDDLDKGGLWLHEMKTKAIVDVETLDTSLDLNFQTMLYMTVLDLRGIKIKGVIYDVIRRPGMKQGVNESLEDYMTRVRSDIRGEKYTQLTGKTKKGAGPDHYFKRWRHSLKEGDLKRWQKRVLNPILYRLLQWVAWHDPKDPWKNPHHYMNPNALVGQYGPCAAYKAITANSYEDLKPRKVMYPELET